VSYNYRLRVTCKSYVICVIVVNLGIEFGDFAAEFLDYVVVGIECFDVAIDEMV
jgi:hypothetical protein